MKDEMHWSSYLVHIIGKGIFSRIFDILVVSIYLKNHTTIYYFRITNRWHEMHNNLCHLLNFMTSLHRLNYLGVQRHLFLWCASNEHSESVCCHLLICDMKGHIFHLIVIKLLQNIHYLQFLITRMSLKLGQNKVSHANQRKH